ncbi:MAG: tetratricopeptide repeat protein [Acidobacteriota bacterium]
MALTSGDIPKLKRFASEAVEWDPNYYAARWLLGEAYLAEGERELAREQAEIALSLNPTSREAGALLKRASEDQCVPDRPPEEVVRRCRALTQSGNTQKALLKLLRTIDELRDARERCPDELQPRYETTPLYEEVMAEWQTLIRDEPDAPRLETIRKRIEVLKKSNLLRAAGHY